MPDATTDFYQTHRRQCLRYSNKLKALGYSGPITVALDAAVAACDTAIANGSLRTDMAVALASLTDILAKYNSLSTLQKQAFCTKLQEDAPAKP